MENEDNNELPQQPEEPLPRSFESLVGGNPGGKTTWPEVVGMTGEEAKTKLEEEFKNSGNVNINVHIIPQGNFVTMDFRTNRVRIFVDVSGKVAVPPKFG